MKRQVDLMNDTEAEMLQEAGTDIAYLTSQGYSPTDAIAKVASAARFSEAKTNLLTYAYTNGMAAEKRAAAGGPFQRLAEFAMPDPKEIHRLVYGQPEKEAEFLPDTLGPVYPATDGTEKTASIPDTFLPGGMNVFDLDPTGMDHQQQRRLFGLPVKTASDDDTDENGKPVGKGFQFSRTSISISFGSPCDGDEADKIADSFPKTLQGHLRGKIGTLTPEMSDRLETSLIRMLGEKKAAMIEANAEADDAFAQACHSLDRFGAKLRHRHLEPSFKRAGLLSVHACHPEIADLLGPYLDEVNGYLVKSASHRSMEITVHHPWVGEAARLQRELAAVADLTVQANRKSAEYEAVCKLYRNRDKIRKSADWSSFLAGSLMPGAGGMAKDLLAGADQSKEKLEIRKDMIDELDDQMHDLNLRDIELQNSLNDYEHDEVLGPFGKSKLIRGTNDLIRTAPKTMRNRALAKAMLQQYLTQARMALPEYEPALKLDKLNPRRDSIVKAEPKKEEFHVV